MSLRSLAMMKRADLALHVKSRQHNVVCQILTEYFNFWGMTSLLKCLISLSLSLSQISDALQQSYATSALWRFLSLGYALMLCPFIIVLGGMFFLATALFFLDDREKAEKQ